MLHLCSKTEEVLRSLHDPGARLHALVAHAIDCDACRAVLDDPASSPSAGMSLLAELAGVVETGVELAGDTVATLEGLAVEDVLLPRLGKPPALAPLHRFVDRNGPDALYGALEAVSLLFVRASEDSLRNHPDKPLQFDRRKTVLRHGDIVLADGMQIAREIARFGELWDGSAPQAEVLAMTGVIGDVLYRARDVLTHFRARALTDDDILLAYLSRKQRVASPALRWANDATGQYVMVNPRTEEILDASSTLKKMVDTVDVVTQKVIEVFDAPESLTAARFVRNKIVIQNYPKPCPIDYVFPSEAA